MALTVVPGKKAADIKLYALSTCGWCHKTKELLDTLGVEYSYEYVDLLEGPERQEAVTQVTHWNPARSFPTLVINNEKCIVGFREKEIKEALKI